MFGEEAKEPQSAFAMDQAGDVPTSEEPSSINPDETVRVPLPRPYNPPVGTVAVVHDGDSGYKSINESDFDEAVHEKWPPKPSKQQAKGDGAKE